MVRRWIGNLVALLAITLCVAIVVAGS